MNEIEIPYYTDKTRISNSNIGWFLNKGPAFLHKMLTEDVEDESTAALKRGTMIHEYILQPEEFQKHYVVWDKSRPSSTQQEAFCQALVDSIEIEPNRAVLSAYKSAYSTRGKTDEVMLSEGLKIVSALPEYIEFLKSKDERILISNWDVKMLEKIKQNIKSHKLAHSLIQHGGIVDLSKDKPHRYDVFHEFHINWEWCDVKCKSLLDCVAFDYDNKRCIITDLKTTQKLWNFEESVKQYDYCRQLAYYTMAAMWFIDNVINDHSQWTFEWYIVGIDTTGTYDIRVFKFDEHMLDYSYDVIHKALVDIKWHDTHNLWQHSRDYYQGDGSEKLILN